MRVLYGPYTPLFRLSYSYPAAAVALKYLTHIILNVGPLLYMRLILCLARRCTTFGGGLEARLSIASSLQKWYEGVDDIIQ